MTFHKLLVPSRSHAYEVHLGRQLLGQVGEIVGGLAFAKRGRSCALITDDRVAPLYAASVVESLQTAGYEVSLVTFPAGESSKSLPEVARIADAMIDARLDRLGFVVALGGGVVGDLAGFVASIYYRGIPFVQIPTTVIAQVDSAIGGKTGVNARAGKNLIGTFYSPSAVVADLDTRDSLPPREFNEGFAEIIKHALLRDRALFESLATFVRSGPTDTMPAIIRRNLEIKAAIVAEDEFERDGVRALLNFGHTVGHAVEQAAGYGRFLHGEAIAVGMVAAGRLSMEFAGFPEEEFHALIGLLRRFGLPTRLPADIGLEPIMHSLGRDKKFEAAAVRFVLVRRMGDAVLSMPGQVTVADVRRVVERLYEEP